MRGVLRPGAALAGGALALLRSGRRRTLLQALGVLVAGAMAGAAVSVAFALSTGFHRAAEAADLPDVIARFDAEDPDRIRRTVRALPNVADVTVRTEIDGVRVAANGRSSDRAALLLVGRGERRGYAIVDGRDVADADDEVVIERGLANAWDLAPGDELDVGAGIPLRIVGVALQPDNVAFPLAADPRIYYARAAAEEQVGGPLDVSQALVWTVEDDRTDITLQQARATTFGVSDLRFVTRTGVRVIIDQAAGIVVALLVAFSLVALVAAGTMLAAQAAAEVQRRLAVIGVQRAIGVPRGTVAAEQALAAALVAAVAGGLGVAVGALVTAGPSAALLEALNLQAPGAALLGPLALLAVVLVLLAALAAGWPAWRAAGRPPVALLRGGELAGGGPLRRLRRIGHRRRDAGDRSPGGGVGGRPRRPRRRAARGGFGILGARLVLARPGRAAATIAVLVAAGSVILLMLGLSSLLVQLRDDPTAIGTRYQLTVEDAAGGDARDLLPAVRRVPGVAAAAPRYTAEAADSFALGEPVQVTAFDRPAAFLDPALEAGRRLRGPGEAEIGTGLASALGVGVGGTLALQLEDGGEARFRVAGVVRALQSDGRVAYVRPDRLRAASPDLTPDLAVRLDPGADRPTVEAALRGLGARPSVPPGASTRDRAFLVTLAAVLRAVAVLDALVCLYALVQALALTARERGTTLALLRAQGADLGVLGRVLLGAGLVLALPAVLLAVLVQRLLLAPAVGELAAGYAQIGAGASGPQVAAVVLGFAALAALAAVLVARRTARRPPVAGLRGD